MRRSWRKRPRAEKPLRFWYELVRRADWQAPADVKDLFGNTVGFAGDNRVIFDIGGNKYRLVGRVCYRFKNVQIKFVGTHREYGKIDAETAR